jgi:hypothetical protein
MGLTSVPDFTMLDRFLQRLDDVTIDRVVGETVRQLRGRRRKGRRARTAVDAMGFWRRERSARSLCGACIITGRNRCRSLIETLFSSVKRRLSAPAPGRSLRTQKRQALLFGLSFNLYRLWRRYLFQEGCQQSRLMSFSGVFVGGDWMERTGGLGGGVPRID